MDRIRFAVLFVALSLPVLCSANDISDRMPHITKTVAGVGTCFVPAYPDEIVIRDSDGKVIDSAQSLIDAEALGKKIIEASNEPVYRAPKAHSAPVLIDAAIGEGEPVVLYSSKTSSVRVGPASNYLKRTVKGLCAPLK